MRHPSLVAAAFLAACNGEPRGETANGAAAPAPGRPDDRIECLVGDMNGFEPVCSSESAGSAEGRVLILRFPSGGFRRLLVAPDGRGVVAADGAEPAHVTILPGNRIEVEIGGDRFRLPAVVLRR